MSLVRRSAPPSSARCRQRAYVRLSSLPIPPYVQRLSFQTTYANSALFVCRCLQARYGQANLFDSDRPGRQYGRAPNSYRKGANIPAPRRRHIHVIPVLLRSLRLEHRPRLEMETRLYFLESMNSSFKSLPSCVMTEFSGCELTEIKTLIRSSCPTATVLSSKSKAIITPINQPPLCIDESRHYATGTGRVSRSEPIV